MTQKELQNLVEEVSLDFFNKPFQHQATFNRRLQTTGGRYHLSTHNLDFNPKFLEFYTLEVFIGIIKHELCHYHLHINGAGYRHQDTDFQKLLHKVDGLRYAPSIELKQDYIQRWVYQCKKCHIEIRRQRRFNTKKFICKKCRGTFNLLKREHIKLKANN